MSNRDESGMCSEAMESHWMGFKEKVMLPYDLQLLWMLDGHGLV